MNTTIILSTILFLCSCNNTPRKEIENIPIGKQWNISLENQLGSIKIILPNQLDTLFSWTQTSDCGDGCSYVDYRIQPKSLPIFKEKGFMYFPPKDSVEQFTIKHSRLNYRWSVSDTSLKQFLNGKLKSEAKKYQSQKFIIDTILYIDKSYFPVIGYITYDSIDKTTTHYLSASTPVKENLLQFFFEYRKSYADSTSNDFIINSFEYLKTIRLDNGR